MKWTTKIKSGLQKTIVNHLLHGLIVLLFLSKTVSAQTYQFSFNETPLSEALTIAAGEMGIRISFDSDKMSRFNISGNISGHTPGDIIQKILVNTGYITELKYNTWLVVKAGDPVKAAIPSVQVQGVVFDRESGEQLPYANLFFSNKNLSLSTSVNGTFGVQFADSANLQLMVQYLGYYLLDTLLVLKPGQNSFRLGLARKMQTLPTVDVPGEKLQMISQNEEAGHFAFNPTRFADLPNYGETDVFRALQLLPGISSTENSAQLNIRGSSADQNLVLFDGFTLYNLDHFFGVFSALNPYVIKNIQVYRGGFDSRYGERVAGIVDITSKSGNQLKPEIYGGINLISANLTTEIPVTKKLTLVAAARRAYSDIYSSWLADALLAGKTGQSERFPGQEANEIEPEFFFSDVNFKLTYNFSQNENISLSAYGAKDYLNSSSYQERPNLTIDTEDINEWGNYGFGVSWKKQWNAKSFTNLQAGHSGYFNDYNNKTVVSGDSALPRPVSNLSANFITNETNDLTDYFMSFQNRYQINRVNQLEWGAAVKFNQFEFYKDAALDVVYNNLSESSVLFSGFLQNKISPSTRFTVKPGFRLNYYNKTGRVYFEPRLAASYNTGCGVVLKMAAGRYFQYLNKSATEQTYGYNRDFWVLADGDEHPVISSTHFIAGASYETKKLFFDVEAYYKSVNGLQEYLFFQDPDEKKSAFAVPPPPTPGLSQFISGTGNAIGIDFLAKYETKQFTSWLSYSLAKATQNFDQINSGADIPSAYDQTHQVKWTNIYAYKKWNFSSLTLFSTGQPYVASTSKDEDFNTTRVYNRLPDYFRIDVSANYNFNIGKVNLTPGFSVINLLNTQNYLDIYTRNFGSGSNQTTETTLVKAQEITLNFYLNFRF